MKSDRENIRFGVPQQQVAGSEESPIGAENGHEIRDSAERVERSRDSRDGPCNMR